jgi:hypothetical protein
MRLDKNGIGINDSGKEYLWDLTYQSISSITTSDLDFFHLTWAKDPEGIEEKFNNADNSIHGNTNGYLPTLINSKYNYRFKDTYHVLDCVPVDWAKDRNKDRQIEYRYNSDWFRSDHFKKEHTGIHVLFSGCSNTEGIGANIENTWSHMLYKKMSEQYYMDGYYNLGQSGAGIESIIHNITKYINEYGAPNFIFLLLPNILRGWKWNEEESRWYYHQDNPWEDNPVKEETIKKHRDRFPTWLFTMSMFLNYCKDKDIKVIWSTWDTWETDNLKYVKQFENTFLPISKITMEDIETKYIDLIKREDAMEARDGHDGYITQTHWYNHFKELLVARGTLNDNN